MPGQAPVSSQFVSLPHDTFHDDAQPASHLDDITHSGGRQTSLGHDPPHPCLLLDPCALKIWPVQLEDFAIAPGEDLGGAADADL
jgi:hypothetical protein